MRLRRLPEVNRPGLSPGFQGRPRVLAAIVQAALQNAGYRTAHFLSGDRQSGLSIGLAGDELVVADLNHPATFTQQAATVCAEKLNAELAKVQHSAARLAHARSGVTAVGRVQYYEVVVSCPKDPVLRALYRSLCR